MKSIKSMMILCALGMSTMSFAEIQANKNLLPKAAYKIGAALGITYLCSQLFDGYINTVYAPVFDGPSPIFSQQPQSIDELQELLQLAIQEDAALMEGNRHDWYIASFFNTMNARELCMQSRVGSITLAKASKKNKKPTITWASIPGLSQEQIQELNELQYQYVQEFSRALRPQKKTYKISSANTNIFGQKTGMYYHVPTQMQKRKVQEMHMRRALSCIEGMMAILEQAAPEPAPVTK